MSWREFVFSPERKWRWRRHLWFWICAYVIAALAYPPFNYREMNGLIDDGPLRYYEMVVTRVTTQILGQMFFVYPLLYWAIPRFFRKKNYLSFFSAIAPLYLLTTFFRMLLYNFFYGPFTFWLHMYPEEQHMSFLFGLRQNFSGPAFSGFTFIFMKLFKDWQVKQTENAMLVTENFTAQVQLLQAQIHPHFLFNTLNNIYSFTLNRSAEAAPMVSQLSDMLGYMSGSGAAKLVPLEQEINLISDYINLERMRYGDKLNLKLMISDDLTGVLVTPLLMIPFVENSFKHGASQLLNDPWIHVRLRKQHNRLHFYIANNKPARAGLAGSGGIGIANVKKRLKLIYETEYDLRIENNSESFAVTLEIPLLTTA